MNRTNFNFLIDLIAFFGFVVLTTTGVLMRYILPPGSGHHTTIWGLDRHDWGGLHFWIAIVFFAILSFHLVLHWRWIVAVFTGRPRQGSGYRAGLGLFAVIVVIALSVSPVLSPVQKNTAREGSSYLSSHKYEGIDIRGSMTLREVEKSTGVPASHIIRSLELPATLSADEQLGSLKRRYGFEMNAVREIVKEYRNQQGAE